MQIESRIVYSVLGKDYGSANAAREAIADEIGRLVDRGLSDAGMALGPRTAITLNDVLLDNAKHLSELLCAYAAPVDGGE